MRTEAPRAGNLPAAVLGPRAPGQPVRLGRLVVRPAEPDGREHAFGDLAVPIGARARMMDGSLPTVTPPPQVPFNGSAACGDYAGMGVVDAGLVQSGLIDPPSGPRDANGNYEGAFGINRSRCFANMRDGTSQTILMAECAGRPQLWRGHKRSAGHVADRRPLGLAQLALDPRRHAGRNRILRAVRRELHERPGSLQFPHRRGQRRVRGWLRALTQRKHQHPSLRPIGDARRRRSGLGRRFLTVNRAGDPLVQKTVSRPIASGRALARFRSETKAAGESQPRRRTLTGLVASPQRSVCAGNDVFFIVSQTAFRRYSNVLFHAIWRFEFPSAPRRSQESTAAFRPSLPDRSP